ncbi:uncharacterized protein LOC123954657 [Meles meles]|uniref:uncharacterized protein LOC123954657 n=1 Tax=Meles meles TaxID=9662 RepID=UPI001E69EEA4|nr:uncharacterized protein LOC123954657 [Meles meles]
MGMGDKASQRRRGQQRVRDSVFFLTSEWIACIFLKTSKSRKGKVCGPIPRQLVPAHILCSVCPHCLTLFQCRPMWMSTQLSLLRNCVSRSSAEGERDVGPGFRADASGKTGSGAGFPSCLSPSRCPGPARPVLSRGWHQKPCKSHVFATSQPPSQGVRHQEPAKPGCDPARAHDWDGTSPEMTLHRRVRVRNAALTQTLPRSDAEAGVPAPTNRSGKHQRGRAGLAISLWAEADVRAQCLLRLRQGQMSCSRRESAVPTRQGHKGLGRWSRNLGLGDMVPTGPVAPAPVRGAPGRVWGRPAGRHGHKLPGPCSALYPGEQGSGPTRAPQESRERVDPCATAPSVLGPPWPGRGLSGDTDAGLLGHRVGLSSTRRPCPPAAP